MMFNGDGGHDTMFNGDGGHDMRGHHLLRCLMEMEMMMFNGDDGLRRC